MFLDWYLGTALTLVKTIMLLDLLYQPLERSWRNKEIMSETSLILLYLRTNSVNVDIFAISLSERRHSHLNSSAVSIRLASMLQAIHVICMATSSSESSTLLDELNKLSDKELDKDKELDEAYSPVIIVSVTGRTVCPIPAHCQIIQHMIEMYGVVVVVKRSYCRAWAGSNKISSAYP